MELQEKPEITAIRELRKPLSWYTKGMENSSEFREKINQIEEIETLKTEIENFFDKN